jgi:hypothetical protein
MQRCVKIWNQMVKKFPRLFEAPPLPSQISISHVHVRTPVLECNVVSKFQSDGCRTFGDAHVWTNDVYGSTASPTVVCVCMWTHLRSGMQRFVQSAKQSVKNCRRVYQAPLLPRRMAMSYIDRNTRGFEWNVVSKFESNRWRTFGVAFIVTNGRLHFYLYR